MGVPGAALRVLRGKTALERGTEQVGLALAFLGHTCIWEGFPDWGGMRPSPADGETEAGRAKRMAGVTPRK